jgi:hypothetical protein
MQIQVGAHMQTAGLNAPHADRVGREVDLAEARVDF